MHAKIVFLANNALMTAVGYASAWETADAITRPLKIGIAGIDSSKNIKQGSN